MFLLLTFTALVTIVLLISTVSRFRTTARNRNRRSKLQYHAVISMQQEPSTPPLPLKLQEQPTKPKIRRSQNQTEAITQDLIVSPSSTHTFTPLQTFTQDPKDDMPWPRIAWLMSFPNSGTSYTMRAVRKYTRIWTASNYIEEVVDHDPVPVTTLSPMGPFWVDRSNFSPPNPYSYVLTKTHCDGYCNAATSCTSSRYIISTSVFEAGCRGIPTFQDSNRSLSDSGTLVSRAVHLIRDPLDNVVSRFHLAWKKFTDEEKLYFTRDHTGFQRFCEKWDGVQDHWEQEHPDESRLGNQRNVTDIDNIPCWAEFYRYASWHNNAQFLIWRLHLPSITLHYDEYENEESWNRVMSRMMAFLNQTKAPKGLKHTFLGGKGYHSYYTVDQQKAIWKLLAKVSIPETWKLIERYKIS